MTKTLCNSCKNCKYYKKSTDYIEGGTCKNPHFIYLGDRDRIPLTNELGYVDSECYDAFLFVGPNFGCIYWRKK